MQKLRAYLIGIDQGQELMFSDFEDGGPMWTGEGPREARKAVEFSESFTEPPTVHLSMGMFDTDGQSNQRADLKAEEITPTGFDVVFRTWGDSRVARVRVDWLAIGAVADDEAWEVD